MPEQHGIIVTLFAPLVILTDRVLQRRPAEKSHRVKHAARGEIFSELINRNDARMVQPTRDLRLVLKTFDDRLASLPRRD